MAVWSQTNTIEVSKNKRFDSEFFHPNYLASEDKVVKTGNVKKLKEIGSFLIGPFGSAFHVSNYDPTSKYRYIRGKDVKPFNLLDDDNVYMPEKDYNRLEKYAVLPNDLLISVVGTLGNVAVVPEDIEGIFSCKSTVFRNSTIDPYYLLAYFNCKYGRDCLLRRQRGAVQTGLNKDDLETVPVPVFSSKEHELIGDIVRKSIELSNKSKSIYAHAQGLLEKELGLDHLVTEKPKSYEAKFSEVTTSSRGDAEFHNPLLKLYYEELSKKHQLNKITYFTKVMKFSNPTYANEGVPIITQKHLETITPNGYGKELLSSIEWCKKNTSAILKNDDLLFYSVGAYLGKTNIWLNDDEAVPASFITLLRPNSQNDAGYLMLLLNSKFGILQSKVFQSGTSQQYIYPKDIRNFLVPIVSEEFKSEIYNLIVQSHWMNKESEQLLEEAKKKVEDLIEGVE